MSNYPDWVNQHKVKGTSVKKVGNSYYLYKSTSKRVPGKKYPQPIQTFIGTITKDGVIASKVRKVSTERVVVYEYGFSYALKQLTPKKFFSDIRDDQKAEYIFLNIVRNFSPTSYLLREQDVPTAKELQISVNAQTKRLERSIGTSITDILPLCYLYLVETNECDMISIITDEIKELMDKLGVSL